MRYTRRHLTATKVQAFVTAIFCSALVVTGAVAARNAHAQKEGPLRPNFKDHIAEPTPSAKRAGSGEGASREGSNEPYHAAQPSIDGLDEGACPICPITDPGEVHVLLALRERRLAISAQEHQLAQREAQLARLARSLDERLAALDSQVQKLEERLQVGEPARLRREAALGALVDSLGSMTPKKAAPMLAEAEPQVVAEVLRRLGPQRSAQLMMAMPASKAGRLINQVVPGRHAVSASRTPLPQTSAPSQPSTPATSPNSPASAAGSK